MHSQDLADTLMKISVAHITEIEFQRDMHAMDTLGSSDRFAVCISLKAYVIHNQRHQGAHLKI